MKKILVTYIPVREKKPEVSGKERNFSSATDKRNNRLRSVDTEIILRKYPCRAGP